MKIRKCKIAKIPDLYVASNDSSLTMCLCIFTLQIFFICIIFPIKCEALEV